MQSALSLYVLGAERGRDSLFSEEGNSGNSLPTSSSYRPMHQPFGLTSLDCFTIVAPPVFTSRLLAHVKYF